MSYFTAGGGATQASFMYKVTKRIVPSIASGNVTTGTNCSVNFIIYLSYLVINIGVSATGVFFYNIIAPLAVSAEL